VHYSKPFSIWQSTDNLRVLHSKVARLKCHIPNCIFNTSLLMLLWAQKYLEILLANVNQNSKYDDDKMKKKEKKKERKKTNEY
jgi:hypothetical protein